MILSAHICSDQIPQRPRVTLPSPGYMLSYLGKWFTNFLTMWSKLCSLHILPCITQFLLFLGLGCMAFLLEYIIFNFFSFLVLFTLFIIAYHGPQHFLHFTAMTSDDSPVIFYEQLAVDLDELSFQPAIQVSMSLPSAEWNVFEPLDRHCEYQHRHKHKGVYISLSFYSLCSVMTDFFIRQLLWVRFELID